MNRDLALFPNNEIGDLLWNWARAGNWVGAPTTLSFLVLFDAQGSAEGFSIEVADAGFGVQLDECPEGYDVPVWEIVVTCTRLPTAECIEAVSTLLATMAEERGGYLDDFATQLSPNNSSKPTPLRGAA